MSILALSPSQRSPPTRRAIMKSCALAILSILIVGQSIGSALGDEQISDYVRKCCISGLRHARTANSCDSMESVIASIPPLWVGLCHSTSEVCCSREQEQKSCELGRLAALEGTRCDKAVNSSSNSFADCCRACQVGLAVKASKQNCRDPLFSFLSAIESYRVCCNDTDNFLPNSNSAPTSDSDNVVIEDTEEGAEDSEESETETKTRPGPAPSDGKEEDADGTIVLTGDDQDVCEQIPNLCQHVCENTYEGYQCSCHPRFKLDANKVTCSPEPGPGVANPNICPTGYELDEQQAKCVDIDECKEELHECKISQYCHNTIGGYHCLDVKAKNCRAGHHYDAQTERCEDDNECEMSPSPCEPGDQCENYPGSYRCKSQTCGIGFYLKDGSCADIDECADNTTNSCRSYLHQECRNTVGSFACHCRPGFTLDVTQHQCVDINECSINNHNCLDTQRCDNTIGSFVCTRLQSCGTGYTHNAITKECDDDDECLWNTHNCPPDYDCHNTKGSFRCHRRTTSTSSTTTTTTTTTTVRPPHRSSDEPVPNRRLPDPNQRDYNRLDYAAWSYPTSHLPCSTGFQRNYLGACVDINECMERQPCGSHERCINTNGHYRCESLLQCAAGYKSTPTGTSCIDIDECETGEHNCGDKQICQNRNGGFICACPTGHQVTRLSNGVNSCVDINECAQDQRVCPSNALCFNTIGSYYCECKSGFEKRSSNSAVAGSDYANAQCFDVDECQDIPGLCQQKCVNFWGGYRCTCNPGYQIGRDNRTCNDIDECEVHKGYKLCMGYCINTAGSYQCSCPRGYTLATDQTTCTDIDECGGDADNHVCTGRHDKCTNIRGSYKCTTINCPPGYIHDPDQKNRCRQNSNMCDGEDCYTKPSAYTYNFITFVSKLMIPPDGRTIFTLRGPVWYDNIDFDLKVVRLHAGPNVERASESHFDTLKTNNQVNLLLKRTLEGPQDIELELSMTVFTNGMPRGKSVAKLFLFVSQYTF